MFYFKNFFLNLPLYSIVLYTCSCTAVRPCTSLCSNPSSCSAARAATSLCVRDSPWVCCGDGMVQQVWTGARAEGQGGRWQCSAGRRPRGRPASPSPQWWPHAPALKASSIRVYRDTSCVVCCTLLSLTSAPVRSVSLHAWPIPGLETVRDDGK